jgi:hypothetical protein
MGEATEGLRAAGAFERKATITATLKADSGYSSTETHRISADQWARICGILAEPPATPTGER